jgi:hypothetical protein
MESTFIQVYSKYLEINPHFQGKAGGMRSTDIEPYIDKFHKNLEIMDTLDDFLSIIKDDLVCILLREDSLLHTYLKVILKNDVNSFHKDDLKKICEIFYHLHFTPDDINQLLAQTASSSY